MNRTTTVFVSIFATLIALLGVFQGIALATDTFVPVTEGFIGGLLPVLCGMLCTLMWCGALKKSEAELQQEGLPEEAE